MQGEILCSLPRHIVLSRRNSTDSGLYRGIVKSPPHQSSYRRRRILSCRKRTSVSRQLYLQKIRSLQIMWRNPQSNRLASSQTKTVIYRTTSPHRSMSWSPIRSSHVSQSRLFHQSAEMFASDANSSLSTLFSASENSRSVICANRGWDCDAMCWA